jgi:tetratricopeptide (TPR) repeat protein
MVSALIPLLIFLWVAVARAARPWEETHTGSADTAEAHLGKGYDLVKGQRYREAAGEFQAALALQPGHTRARYQLAVCWFALGQLEEAQKEFQRLREETHNDANVIYYLGRMDLLGGNADSAIREFERVASNPPFADTPYHLGSAYLKKGELQEALKWLREAAKAMPRDFRVHDHLARVSQREGNRSEAEKEYAISAQQHQHVDEASRSAVTCSRELETGSSAEARRTCQQLLDSRDPDKLTTLGLLYGQHGYYEESIAPLEQAAQLDAESWEIQHDLGLSYFRLRRYQEARAPLEKAVAFRRDFFGSTALLGATLFALGEDERSYPLLYHAHQLNPQDEDTASLLFKTSVVLARKEFEQKKYERSPSFLKTASELHSTDAEVHRRLAEVHAAQGRHVEADHEKAEAERLSQTRSP